MSYPFISYQSHTFELQSPQNILHNFSFCSCIFFTFFYKLNYLHIFWGKVLWVILALKSCTNRYFLNLLNILCQNWANNILLPTFFQSMCMLFRLVLRTMIESTDPCLVYHTVQLVWDLKYCSFSISVRTPHARTRHRVPVTWSKVFCVSCYRNTAQLFNNCSVDALLIKRFPSPWCYFLGAFAQELVSI